MMEILHTEVRKLLSGGLRRDVQREKTTKIFTQADIIFTILRSVQTFKRGDMVEALLNMDGIARIARCITKNPAINLEELHTQFGMQVDSAIMHSSPFILKTGNP